MTNTKEETPSPKHLEWVIKGRAENQITSLRLYALMLDYKKEIRAKNLATDAQDLAAVCFSLWRAVFWPTEAESYKLKWRT
jgi:hypothetical protein